MLDIEMALRGGAAALLLLTGAVLRRDARHTGSGPFSGLLALSAAAYVVVSTPGTAAIPWLLPLRLISIGTPALLWSWTGPAFDDEFRPSWRDAACWLALVALGAAEILGRYPPAGLAREGLSLLFIALAAGRAVAGLREDLVERRRRLRLALASLAILYASVIVVGDVLNRGRPLFGSSSLADAAGLAALAMVFALAGLSANRPPDNKPAADAGAAAEPPGKMPGDMPAASDGEADLLYRLHRVMDEDKAYRQEGFGIAVLAARLAVPEYRLRRLINQRLGHRNFTSFVNGYRLAEAMAALADPSQAEVPILTIALDAGFQSIGPFNRAFKALTQMTPTDYRNRAKSGIGQAVSGFGQPDAEIGKTG